MKKIHQHLIITASEDKNVGKKFLWANGGQIKTEKAAKPHKIRLSDWKSMTKLDTVRASKEC